MMTMTSSPGRIGELEERLRRVGEEIEKERVAERRCAIATSAYEKLSEAIRGTLTAEEKAAVDGMYLFLHDGQGDGLCVDLVRNIPSATDKGQGRRLDELMTTAETMMEMKALAGG